MSEAMCASASPQERYDLVAKLGFDLDSEAGQDSFYELYAEKLQRLLDREVPNSKATREALESAMTAVIEFACRNAEGGTGFGHEGNRIPARAAWIVYTLYSKHPRDIAPSAKLEDAFRSAEVRGRAAYKLNPASSDLEFDRSNLPLLKKAAEYFVFAQRGLNDQMKIRLSEAFMNYLKKML